MCDITNIYITKFVIKMNGNTTSQVLLLCIHEILSLRLITISWLFYISIGFFDHKIRIYLYIKLLINILVNTIVSFNISINIINNSGHYVYYIKYTMGNLKNIILLITIYFIKIKLLINI